MDDILKQEMTFDQAEFAVRCEWGENGVSQLAPIGDVVIIVDVLPFSTRVEIATNREATVFLYRRRDETAATFAAYIFTASTTATRARFE